MVIANKITTLTCILALAGCATPYGEVPVAKNFPAASQEKLQAASHWGIITNDLSKKIQASMVGKVEKNQPLYVSSKSSSAFNQAVVAELISSLVANDFTVINNAGNSANAVKVDVDTQVLEFSAGRMQAKKAGVPTAIATGIWALTEIGTNFSAAGAVTGIVIGADAAQYFNSDKASGATPKTEIIINVAVADANHYIAVSRGTYYVADSDKQLYISAGQSIQIKSFSVRGSEE